MWGTHALRLSREVNPMDRIDVPGIGRRSAGPDRSW